MSQAIETPEDRVQRAPGHALGDVRNAIPNRNARIHQQFVDLWGDSNTRFHDQLKSFLEEAIEERPIQQFKFWSHFWDSTAASFCATQV